MSLVQNTPPMSGAVDVQATFKAAWEAAERRAGERPSLEQLLRGMPLRHAAVLIEALVETDLEFRARLGEQPALAEYLERFPQLQRGVSTAFPSRVGEYH